MEYIEELLKILLHHVARKLWGVVRKKSVSDENLEVLHRSNNFIVLNKRYDVVINSNDPNVKVRIAIIFVLLWFFLFYCNL